MSEEPKSIWKKSVVLPKLFIAWLVLLCATTLVFSIILLIIGEPFKNLSDLAKTFIASLFIASGAFCLWIFVRWLCCWRNFKRFLFGFACLATLIALFYAEEDWRGKHDWEKFKREWEAKGEKFDFKDFVPPPVPDDQNFAMAPIFDTTDKLASRKWRTEHTNQHYGKGGDQMPWDTNLVDPLQMELENYAYNDVRTPTNGGNWQLAKMADLKEWQNYYRTLAAKTNEFPIAAQPQSPPQDILLALSKYDSTIEELRQASQLPYSRFPLDYDDEDPAEILLPHLAALKRCSQVLRLRSLAELQNGQSDKAFDDVKLSLRLIDSIQTEPFIISHLVRIAILHIAIQPIYEGLAEHKWSDAQLAELDLELAKLNFPQDYEFSVRSERAEHIKIIDWLEQKRSRFLDLFDMIESDQQNKLGRFLGTTGFYLMPEGWFYQNKLVMAQLQQEYNLPMVDDTGQIIAPKKVSQLVSQANNEIGLNTPLTPFNFFARLLLPGLDNFAQKIAYGQNAADLARVAIALERYRLAHGEFPDSLDALAPQFMEKIPHDIINGEPLKYRRTNDGQFILYSVGWNETDDGGVIAFKKNSSADNIVEDRDSGDWVWRYPQK